MGRIIWDLVDKGYITIDTVLKKKQVELTKYGELVLAHSNDYDEYIKCPKCGITKHNSEFYKGDKYRCAKCRQEHDRKQYYERKLKSMAKGIHPKDTFTKLCPNCNMKMFVKVGYKKGYCAHCETFIPIKKVLADGVRGIKLEKVS